jgi:8-oxo-dGTP pyrophosphatase MutT (NUDIX family)
MSNAPNPWTLIDATTVYENPWIRVEDHRVLNPSGQPGQYGKVCFKSRAIAIVPVDADGHTYLVGQYRYTLDEYSWELPMGGAAPGEDPLEAAQRELREETGLEANQWQRIMRLHTSNSVTDEEGFVFLASGLRAGPANPEPTEKLEVERVPFAEAIARALDGRITDAMSVAAILHVAVRQQGTRT